MDALALSFSVHAAGTGVLLKQSVERSLRARAFTRRRSIVSAERKRLTTRVIASAAAAETQSVESNGHGLLEEQEASKRWKFNWETAWYPIAVTKDLDKDGPTASTIIGRPLAIWWDKSTEKWQVYDDLCPHRLAPLSEGSITAEGHLRCSYHGWAFKGDNGECTVIPQAPKDDQKLHASKKACVKVYPSMVQQGILWFWPDRSQGAVNVEAAANPPPMFTEFSDPSFGFDMSSRDLEYGYDVLIENLMDPSHVNFAHHRIQGNRKNARPLNYQITSKITPAGFSGKDEMGISTFYPPCCFTMAITLPSKPSDKAKDYIPGTKWELKGSPKEKAPKQFSLVFLCIPVSPGRSRLIWSFPRNFFTVLFKFVPAWWTHITNNLVLDSDLLLLHLLGKRLEHEGPKLWAEKTYTPAGADAYVIGFRKWLNEFAGGAPDWGGWFENRIPPSPPKEIMLDRYYSHVVRCKSCMSALKGFRALEVGLQILGIALVGLVAASAVLPIRPVARLAVPLVIGAVLSTILSKWLANFIYKTFYFHDYNHAAVKD